MEFRQESLVLWEDQASMWNSTVKEGGWAVFPCGSCVEIWRFLCFYSRWMRICWVSKSMCLARFPRHKKYTTLRGFTPPKKHVPTKKHFTKWNFIFQPIFCKGYVSFRGSMGILFSSQWYGGVHQWQTRSAFMFFLLASYCVKLELRNLIINSMMLWR